MLNPFKKKENSYKLDETTLPSMGSSTNQSTLGQDNPPIPQSPNFDNHPASTDSSENSQLVNENPYNPGQFPSPNQDSSMDNNSFNSSSYSYQPQPSPSLNTNTDTNSNNNQGQMSSIQLETLDKKLSLLDTRISIMEDKINKIYEMISIEVGPETRMRANVGTNSQHSNNNN